MFEIIITASILILIIADLLPHADQTGTEVTVYGHISAAVVDDDVIAVAACVKGTCDHLAVCGYANRADDH